MRWNSLLLGMAGTIALLAVGCGDGDGFATSTGSVTFDGQPVATGAISFHPLERGPAPQGAQIVGGKVTMLGNVVQQTYVTNLPFAAAVATLPVIIILLYLLAVRKTGALENV